MIEGKVFHEKGLLLEAFGVLAIIYGIIQYLMAGLGWPSYGAWMAGGVILLLVGWAKKSMS
ncbi:MAG: hypothetical protein HYT08_03415 [Candidatus Levybacteria bacterium]|nr:hypothetical protein [Candidatus Levybacteria bacterium]